MNYEKMVDLLNNIVEQADSEDAFTMTSQLTPLSMMDEEIKKNYIKILCNFAYFDDEMIDSNEYAEIMSLIVRIEMSSNGRLIIRAYMLDGELHEKNHFILSRISESADEESYNNDEEIISQRKNDSEIKKSMKDLAAKATAVGVPMAAIYFSGSVVGVSAAGLTSGLANLGMGGILGFSGMVTGIGVAILLGVGAYKGVKKLTGISDIENNKQRELMIQAIIRNSQKSMNFLIEDLNELSRQLTIELSKGLATEVKIHKLAKMIGMLSKGAEFTSEKIDNAQKESVIAKLPKYISETRVVELTTEATKAKQREFIMSCYNKVSSEDENGSIMTKYELNDQMTEIELSQLQSVLESVSYFNIKDATFASAKGFVKNAFSK